METDTFDDVRRRYAGDAIPSCGCGRELEFSHWIVQPRSAVYSCPSLDCDDPHEVVLDCGDDDVLALIERLVAVEAYVDKLRDAVAEFACEGNWNEEDGLSWWVGYPLKIAPWDLAKEALNRPVKGV